MKYPDMRPVSIALVIMLTIPVVTARGAGGHGCWGFLRFGQPYPRLAAIISAANREGVMQVNSKAISSGGQFPKRNTCDGADQSPDLAWTQPPAGTKSLALILDDPDAPSGTFTHWLVFNIPPSAMQLPEGLDKHAPELTVGSQGRNDFGKVGYGGPCPPPGKPHRYFFRLYALDTVLNRKPGQTRRTDIDTAIQGHVLARGELMGRYGR